jgi:predicted DNA-binding transcriptional regulator YafY
MAKKQKSKKATGTRGGGTKFRSRWRHVAVIDQMVRSGQPPTGQQMADRLEVSWRTAMRDIEFMRDDLGAPLVFDRKLNGYVYSEPHWSMPNIRLTEGDLLAVCVAERVLEGFGDTPLAETLRRAFEKITAALPDEIEATPADLAMRYDFTMSGLAIVPDGVLDTFQQAVRENRQVKMSYYSPGRDEQREYVVEPYLLMQRDGAWYVAARDTARDSRVPLFNLSRVRELALLDSEFEYILSDFDREAYLGEMGSTFHGTKAHRVVVDFSGSAAFYVRERIWQKGQKLTNRRDGSLRFEVTVPHMWDIIPWILRWGAAATVVKPKSLVDHIAQESQRMADKYSAL